ncbi:hypothetical protein SERLA73DRAFT_191328 [Serpula lacrymans var. lacrymans S7.3]|uniref:MYND-type domain-containing protein n=2 Tax=Serpula lacrymans var. lacrymans TaxID=341189 RepID=F8QHB2_SERL3|nr:uncharacterized protein SERLADRAFT_477674 [Serpula lacrymans var. lacrymans S7.9]EGN92295.1 hypothetical protein SERLA73DRAFT_191328 [Serpula lacrymans var. lacrymans S7.3]EGO20264.1 hypothetical protein SERLADRAFT_477674 [Serpula lacrymans var. lacrymans S7.9]
MPKKKCSKCSQGDSTPMMRCSKCKNRLYCSKECQIADWFSHKEHCASAPSAQNTNVTGIVIACNKDRVHNPIFQSTVIEPTHQIHSLGIECPLFNQVGFPIVMYRHIRQNSLTMHRDPGLDNQIATYLMIEPTNGFATPE